MHPSTAFSLLALLSASSSVLGQQTGWGQCGGKNWAGPTTCVAGWVCTYGHEYYSQCLQAPVGVTTTTSRIPSPTPYQTPISSSSTTLSRTTTLSRSLLISSTSVSRTTTFPTTSPTTMRTTTTTFVATTVPGIGTYPGPTLLPNYLWIRAVTAPHFHEYLQSPASTGIIASHSTAGQFTITSGQLIQTTSSGLLYANVEQRSDATDMLLGVTFTSVPNAFGAFSWSGDALQWTVGSITRPNPSAWYVCGDANQLFINLGQYLYGTPVGCSDHTIHFYNGATADL